MLQSISAKLFFLLFIICFPIMLFGQTEQQIDSEKLAISALQAQIEASQKQITSLTAKELNARNSRNTARNDANKAKKEVETAEREYREALTNLRENPQSQTARTTVNIASNNLEEVNTIHKNKEKQANAADELWKAADGELKREKANLEEIEKTKRVLESGEISPEDVLAKIPARFKDSSDPTVIVPVFDTIAITDTISIIDTVSVVDTVFVDVEGKTEYLRYIFSVRPELIAGTMHDDIAVAGGSVEGGVIIKNGCYITADFSGNKFGLGGAANFGYCFNRKGFIKAVPGVTAGLYNSKYDVYFTKDDKKIANKEAESKSFAGIFAKLIGGKTHNFDITYKLSFGKNKVPKSYREDIQEFEFDEDFALRHSLSIGYAFIKTAKGRKNENN